MRRKPLLLAAVACVALAALLLAPGCKLGGQKGGDPGRRPTSSASVQKFTPLTWNEILGPVEGTATEEEVLAPFGGALPDDVIVRPGRKEQFENRPYFALSGEPVITSDDILNAEVVDVGYGPTVAFTLTPEAGERFRQFTRDNASKGLAIVMDGEVISNPVIRDEIGAEGVISGHFTPEEVQELAARLKAK